MISGTAFAAGVIVNDIGVAGARFDFDHSAGSAGNAALMAFTRALGGRGLADGILLVGINPGPVETYRILALMESKAKSRFGDEERTPELTASGSAAQPSPEASPLIGMLTRELKLRFGGEPRLPNVA
jgi:NAD(P)-dependent dehydrogenase (short-subunit alcohol dehydrogenase family)